MNRFLLILNVVLAASFLLVSSAPAGLFSGLDVNSGTVEQIPAEELELITQEINSNLICSNLITREKILGVISNVIYLDEVDIDFELQVAADGCMIKFSTGLEIVVTTDDQVVDVFYEQVSNGYQGVFSSSFGLGENVDYDCVGSLEPAIVDLKIINIAYIGQDLDCVEIIDLHEYLANELAFRATDFISAGFANKDYQLSDFLELNSSPEIITSYREYLLSDRK